MAMRVVKIFEAKMSATAPSAHKIDKLAELKLKLAEAEDGLKPPRLRNAIETISKQERCTHNFARLYKGAFEPQYISEMEVTPDWNNPNVKATDDNGTTVTAKTVANIANEVTTYYKYLFDENETTVGGRHLAYTLLQTTPINKVGRNACDANITLQEVRSAMKACAARKAPGPDGLPGAVYKQSMNLLAPMLYEVLAEAQRVHKLPASFRKGQVCLLYKKETEQTCGTTAR